MNNKGFIATVIILLISVSAFSSEWPDSVKPVDIDPDSQVTVSGNLVDGFTMSRLDWASLSSTACFPATQFDSFRGNHVLYGTSIPRYSVMTITVTPLDGQDISLYGYLTGTTDFNSLPPAIKSVLSCEASYNNGKPDPGVSSSIMLNSTTNPYNVVFAVTGPAESLSGRFRVDLDLQTRDKEPEVNGPLQVTTIKSKQNGTVEVTGTISSGQFMPIRWANSSQAACFPATQNSKFMGNHVFYRVDLPRWTKMNISMQPAKGTDLNLYAYRTSPKATKNLPPNVSTGAAEASYSYNTPNPGEKESVRFQSGRNEYSIVIGVAGPHKVTSGEFSLSITLEKYK
jgi:hypothetical protein